MIGQQYEGMNIIALIIELVLVLFGPVFRDELFVQLDIFIKYFNIQLIVDEILIGERVPILLNLLEKPVELLIKHRRYLHTLVFTLNIRYPLG